MVQANDAATGHGFGRAERVSVSVGVFHWIHEFRGAAAGVFVDDDDGVAAVFVDGYGTHRMTGQKAGGLTKPRSSAEDKKLREEEAVGTCLMKGTPSP